MAATQTKRPSARPEHQVTARDYPAEWARQIELYLDQDHRRALLYGGLFGAFVLIMVVSMAIGLAL